MTDVASPPHAGAGLSLGRQVRRGRQLAWATVGWNSVEGGIALAAGVAAGSVALIGFGSDSYVEVATGLIVLWRLAQERHGSDISAAAERRAVRLIALTFLLLAVGIAADALYRLSTAQRPDVSVVGMFLTVCSLVLMPLLARAKRAVAARLDSRALAADAMQTQLCTYLSAAVLLGLALHGLLGWWWADPVAALVVAAVAGKEGIAHLRADRVGECCA